MRYVKEAAQAIGRALRGKNGYHLVVLNSTVLPGSTQYGVMPVLEKESGKKCIEDFGLCYSPEFVALGSVIPDTFSPDLLLVGESDPRAGGELVSIYERLCENEPGVARMNFVNAELAKVAVNTYVTMKISFANTMADICEQLPGGDVDAVTSALGLDTRIGRRYLRGALGYGGPCFPRDNLALTYLARKLGQPSILAEAIDSYNRTLGDSLVEKTTDRLIPGGTVAVLGLAYKPDTNVIDASPGLELAKSLAGRGVKVLVYDPLAMENARRVLGDSVQYGESVDDCVSRADVIVIANPDREFGAVNPGDSQDGSRTVVIDAWRGLRGQLGDDGRIDYRAIGLGTEDPSLASRLAELWKD